jgi:hypothetical protein
MQGIADLRYGTVAVNHWSGVSFGLGTTTWGAFPGSMRDDDPGSGTGVVHNALMFSRAEKSVVRAPFRARPKPVWFPGHRSADALAVRLLDFETEPSVRNLVPLLPSAVRS